jgi:hypothetical protein
MKKYGKKWGKVYQVRLSEEEHAEMIDFIKRFNVTNREFILAVKNYLKDAYYLKNGWFYQSIRDYAYKHGEYHKNIKDNCELCNDKYRYLNRTDTAIIGHHFNGYDEKNINNVKWLCRRCHGFVHRRENKDNDWDQIILSHKKWDGKNRDEEINEYLKNLEANK